MTTKASHRVVVEQQIEEHLAAADEQRALTPVERKARAKLQQDGPLPINAGARALPRVLLVQPRAPPPGDRPDDAGLDSPRPSRAAARRPRRCADAAYARHPERFVRKPPAPPQLPSAAWINKPKEPASAH
jgi:hypothetical protein